MSFVLPELPYEANALEPYISKETIDFHYGKHHQGYVNKLNSLVPGTSFENATLEEIVKKADGGIFNNGAQVWNHSFYWNCLKPGGGGKPSSTIADAIVDNFGSFEDFKNKFSDAAATLFGSGWAWLVKTPANTLEIVQTANAGNPLRDGKIPILTCDVWEHAYYLGYQNRRPDYIEAFFNLIDWQKVSDRL